MRVPFRKYEYYIESANTEMTLDVFEYWMNQHKIDCARFRYLRDMYEGLHPILFEEDKPKWKPDNRVVMNFAKYIVDTLNGYFLGNPVKTMSLNGEIDEAVHEICDANDQDDNNFELSKICSIYGSGYELVYLDEDAKPRITYLSPLEAFVIYDDNVERVPLYGVRYYFDRDHVMHGMLYTRSEQVPFSDEDGFHFIESERRAHFFDGVPIIEYIENEERQSAFEHVISAIIAYEKALSEKANDVDAFADAYMLIKGLDLEDKDVFRIRQDRVIHVPPNDSDVLNATEVSFLARPSGDETQENLLDRLEQQIFNISMVANISDEEFGGSSGTALAYKLQPMRNLASVKARKFESGMNRRWMLISSLPLSPLGADGWKEITYRFTFNAPQNLLEEAQTAAQMAGITSKRTQLSVMSAVGDVREELEQIEREEEAENEFSGQYDNTRLTED